MNDNVCAVKEESIKEIVTNQTEIIDAINSRLDGFLENTLPAKNEDIGQKPIKSVDCFIDALENNRQRLTDALNKLDVICRTFFD